MRKRTITAAALVGAAVVAGSAGPAAAEVRPFGGHRVVVGGCGPTYAGADGVTAPDGSTRGFATCLAVGGPIRFYERAGDGTVRGSRATGVSGEVLAVAADATATYLLYRTGTTLHVGKRTAAGAFSARAVAGGVRALGGADIVARDGRWLGVWSLPAGAADRELFQAGTDLAPTRITAAPGVEDADPSLAYDGAVPVLVWSRFDVDTYESDLWTADRVGGTWRSRTLATAGYSNYDADIAVAGGIRFVTWRREFAVMVASDRGGSYTSRRFALEGYSPKVAASTTAGGVVDAVFVAYTGSGSGQPFFAESRGSGGSATGTWQGRYLASPSGTGSARPPVAIGAVGGKAEVTYRGESAVFTIRQG